MPKFKLTVDFLIQQTFEVEVEEIDPDHALAVLNQLKPNLPFTEQFVFAQLVKHKIISTQSNVEPVPK